MVFWWIPLTAHVSTEAPVILIFLKILRDSHKFAHAIVVIFRIAGIVKSWILISMGY